MISEIKTAEDALYFQEQMKILEREISGKTAQAIHRRVKKHKDELDASPVEGTVEGIAHNEGYTKAISHVLTILRDEFIFSTNTK